VQRLRFREGSSARKKSKYIENPLKLTYAADGEEAGRVLWRRTLREKWLQDVGAEGEGHDGLRTGSHDHALNPETDEGHKGAEGLHDISVVSSRLGDHCSQLRIAIGTHLEGLTNIIFLKGFLFYKTRYNMLWINNYLPVLKEYRVSFDFIFNF